MNRPILAPLVFALALATGTAFAADTAQSYGYTDREGATYQESIAGDAYASVYGDGRADDYHDYSDYGSGDSRGYPPGIVSDVAGDARRGGDVLIVPDRHGRDGDFAMARVVDVEPLVSRDACRADGRYADAGGYRGEYAGDRYYPERGRSGDDGYYYPDDGYAGDDGYYYPDDGYAGDDDYRDGYHDRGGAYYPDDRYAGGYGRAQPRTSGVGAAIGAIVGGVIGNELGDDDDRHGYYGYSGQQAAATMIGAVLGGVVGAGVEREIVRNREQRHYGQQQRYGQAPYDRSRDAVYAGASSTGATCAEAAYRVKYEYAGRQYQAVTDYPPGDEIRVRIEVP